MLAAEVASLLTGVLAYLLGSIPFGLLLTRLAGVGDIRRVGSGNIGATNVLRTGRRGLAAGTLLLDGAKGGLAVSLAAMLAPGLAPLAAVAAVAGHCFPVWIGFRGGKGVATALGAMLALFWPIGVVACLAWAAGAGLSRISSVGAIAAMLAGGVMGCVLLRSPFWIGPVLVAALVLWRHRGNVARLRAGTEPRIGRA